MRNPIINQRKSRIQFSQPKKNIIIRQTRIPARGTKGTKGVLKGRGRPGSMYLNTRTPAQTVANANNVPILVMLPTRSRGAKAPMIPTKAMSTRLDRQGV